MKFNKNGEKPQVQKKHNFRFDENGHIIVQDPIYNVLPTGTVTIESKGTQPTVSLEVMTASIACPQKY